MQIAQIVDRYKKEIFFGFLGVVLLFALLLLWQIQQSKAEVRAKASFIALTEKAYLAKEAKDFDQCKSLYETLYKDAKNEAFFRVLALHGLAQCFELKGDFKEASSFYLRASKEPQNLAPWMSRFQAANALIIAKDPQAKSLLETLQKDPSVDIEIKAMAEEKLLWLALQKS